MDGYMSVGRAIGTFCFMPSLLLIHDSDEIRASFDAY